MTRTVFLIIFFSFSISFQALSALSSDVHNFNEIIQDFRRSHPSPTQAEMQSLLKKPLILKHLTRPFNPDKFNDCEPIDCSEEELWIYSQLDSLNIPINYRNGIAQGTFYHQYSMETLFLRELMKELCSKEFQVTFPLSSFEIRKFIDNYQLNLPWKHWKVRTELEDLFTASSLPPSQKGRFLITPYLTEDKQHISIVAHILDKGCKRVQFSFSIDSADYALTFSPDSPTFSLRTNYIDPIVCTGNLAGTEERHPIRDQIQSNNIYKNNQGVVEVFKILKTSFDSPKPSDLAFKELFDGLILDVGNICGEYKNDCQYTLVIKRTTPLVHIRLGLQEEKDDYNCALYVWNILKALKKVAEDQDASQTLFDLSDKIEKKEDDASETEQKIKSF